MLIHFDSRDVSSSVFWLLGNFLFKTIGVCPLPLPICLVAWNVSVAPAGILVERQTTRATLGKDDQSAGRVAWFLGMWPPQGLLNPDFLLTDVHGSRAAELSPNG